MEVVRSGILRGIAIILAIAIAACGARDARQSSRDAAVEDSGVLDAGAPDGGDADGGVSDDLPRSTPEQQGIDAAALAAAYDEARALPDMLSLLVLRNGFLVAEEYFGEYGPDEAGNIKSVSKSLLSALVGIALRLELLDDVDQTVATLLPDYFTDEIDPAKRDITLRHLLTMTAGFEWDENGPVFAEWVRSPDWVQFALDQPLANPPGDVFNYNTSLTHLLSAILTEATGASTLDFATDHLLEPAGLSVGRWDRAPEGTYIGGAEVYMTARDLARFGLLFLDRGVARGRGVVPGSWVSASTERQVLLAGYEYDYGYLWWLGSFAGHDAFFAWGYGGQFVFCFPDLDLVVVITSSWWALDPQPHYAAVFDLLENDLLPAVR